MSEAVKNEPFDTVAFMRRHREGLSRAYAGLTVEQIEVRIQQLLKDDPLWRRSGREKDAEEGTVHPWFPSTVQV